MSNDDSQPRRECQQIGRLLLLFLAVATIWFPAGCTGRQPASPLYPATKSVAQPTPSPPKPQPDTPLGHFIEQIAPLAQAEQRETGVPASFSIAQAIHESWNQRGGASSDLARLYNNYHGIRCSEPKELPCVQMRNAGTGAMDSWNSYSSATSGFIYHGRWLRQNSNYVAAFDYANDPLAFARAVLRCYTGCQSPFPQSYFDRLSKLIADYDLRQYDKTEPFILAPQQSTGQIVRTVVSATVVPRDVMLCAPIEELSISPSLMVTTGTVVNIHARVRDNGCFEAMRLRIDDKVVYVSEKGEALYEWNTDGYSLGVHIIALEVATNDNQEWTQSGWRQVELALPVASAQTCPDRLAYASWPDGDIWLMNGDGSGKSRLIADARVVGEISWSPDGRRLAYAKNCSPRGSGGCTHIAIVSIDGTGLIEVGESSVDGFPSWSPDGSRIAYGSGTLHLINADGTGHRVIAQGAAMPDWSPDASKLVYAGRTEDANRHITALYVANADGSAPVPLTEGTICAGSICSDMDPDWSPDGGRIAFVSGPSIYILDLSNLSRSLLVKQGDDPSWSPDGSKITFDVGSDIGVYVVNTDGSDLKRIADGFAPTWQPCPIGRIGTTPTSAQSIAPPTATTPTSSATRRATITPTPVPTALVQRATARTGDRSAISPGPPLRAPTVTPALSGKIPERPADGKRIKVSFGGPPLEAITWSASLSLRQNTEVYDVAFSKDGRMLVSGGTDEVYLWSLENGALLGTLTGDLPSAHVALSPDGRILGAGDSRSAVRLWDPLNKRLLAVLDGHRNVVEDIAFSKDGSLLATASADNTVRLWQVASRTTARVLAQGTPSNAVAFAPDGLTLASGAWDEIRLWSIWDGKQVGTLGGPEKCCAVTTLAYSPDGELLVSGGADGYVNIWRMTDNSLIRAIRPWTNTDARVTSVAVSPDGRLLAVGTNCNLVSVWSMADGGLLYVFTEATSGANGVEFSPDGELLAAAAGDRRVWLWTMK